MFKQYHSPGLCTPRGFSVWYGRAFSCKLFLIFQNMYWDFNINRLDLFLSITPTNFAPLGLMERYFSLNVRFSKTMGLCIQSKWHDLEMHLALLTLFPVISVGFLSQKDINADILCYICCLPETLLDKQSSCLNILREWRASAWFTFDTGAPWYRCP